MKVIHFIASVDKSGGGTTEYIRLLSKVLKNSHSLIIATGISNNPIVIDGVSIEFFNCNIGRLATHKPRPAHPGSVAQC